MDGTKTEELVVQFVKKKTKKKPSSPLLDLPPLQARSLAQVKLTIGRVPSGLPSKLLLSIRSVLEVTGVELTDFSTITTNIPIHKNFSCPRRFIMTSN